MADFLLCTSFVMGTMCFRFPLGWRWKMSNSLCDAPKCLAVGNFLALRSVRNDQNERSLCLSSLYCKEVSQQPLPQSTEQPHLQSGCHFPAVMSPQHLLLYSIAVLSQKPRVQVVLPMRKSALQESFDMGRTVRSMQHSVHIWIFIWIVLLL